MLARRQFEHRIEIIQDGQEIGLGDQQQIGGAEHDRVLRRLVVAFCDGQQYPVTVLPQIEIRRANQVADVLDEQDINSGKTHGVQGVLHRVWVQMGSGAGRDLHC